MTIARDQHLGSLQLVLPACLPGEHPIHVLYLCIAITRAVRVICLQDQMQDFRNESADVLVPVMALGWVYLLLLLLLLLLIIGKLGTHSYPTSFPLVDVRL